MGLCVIVDGNNHFHKSLYASSGFGKGRLLSNDKDREIYIKKVAMDLAFILRMFEPIEKIIFTLDDYSWRRDINISENDGYKANRDRDESVVDWDSFNNLNREFINILSDKGFISSNVKHCEGDDLMYFWSDKLYNDGHDVVIVSGDGDISQLAKFNDKNYITVFSPKASERKLIAPIGFKSWLDDKLNTPEDPISVFMNSDFLSNTCSTIEKLLRTIPLKEIDTDDVLFEKIVCGDGSDNIPAIVNWQTTQSSGKIINNRISGAKAQKIKDIIKTKNPNIDVTKLFNYAKDFKNEINISYKKDFDTLYIEESLKRNTKLVRLHTDEIPKEQYDLFLEHYELNKNKKYPSIESMHMNSILKDTKYASEIKIESDVFSMFSNKQSKQLF
jgi:hypothetical protein